MDTADRSIIELLQGARVGRENAIERYALLDYVNRMLLDPITERELRLRIHALRRQGYPICSQGGLGYYWPTCKGDIFDTVQREFRAKAMDMLVTARAMRKAAYRDFGNQLELW